MKDLIIISCSSLKKELEGEVNAWDLYDGVVYRLLKKNHINFNQYDIVIVSAKYGVIFPNSSIEYYDQLMSKKRARELKDKVSSTLKNIVQSNYGNIHIVLGKNYLFCADLLNINDNRFIYYRNTIGITLGRLKKLLKG